MKSETSPQLGSLVRQSLHFRGVTKISQPSGITAATKKPGLRQNKNPNSLDAWGSGSLLPQLRLIRPGGKVSGDGEPPGRPN